MNLSAALLVKRSTLQLNRFFRKTPKGNKGILVDPFEILPTEDQLEGNRQAEAKAVSKYLEMQSVFTHRNINIYFSIDEIVIKGGRYYLLEHKWLREKEATEDWFFRQSIIQTAFQGSLAHYSKDFKTAGYFKKGEQHQLTLPQKYYSRLQFGDTSYDVKYDSLQVIRFYLTKARALQDYGRSKRFDESYKHREHEYFFSNNYITFVKTRTRKKS